MNTMSQMGQVGQQLRGQARGSAYDVMTEANQAAAQNLLADPMRQIAMTQPEQFNIQNALMENERKNQSALANFREQMRAYAARESAQAQRDAGGSGGIYGMLFG
jgi:hypothetical protein